MKAILCVAALALLAAEPRSFKAPLGLDAYMPVPEDNPITPEKVALGRKLFFERRLPLGSQLYR